ncbi:uncharacterized protein [Triticum aestivum]|uniref:uncharacterized protein n=1 Tax=Triticum aestivum TaxID=4565 RepID=UPI001D029762|nr:uncharacterized protein LOC123106753 [Triticum aestivum]
MPRAGHPLAPLEHKGRPRDPQANPSPTFSLSRRLPLCLVCPGGLVAATSPSSRPLAPPRCSNSPGAPSSYSAPTASARSSRSAFEPSPSASFPDYIRRSPSLDPRLSNELRHHRAFCKLRYPETDVGVTEYDYVIDVPSSCATELPGKPPLINRYRLLFSLLLALE